MCERTLSTELAIALSKVFTWSLVGRSVVGVHERTGVAGLTCALPIEFAGHVRCVLASRWAPWTVKSWDTSNAARVSICKLFMWAARWDGHCLIPIRDRGCAVGDQASLIARYSAATVNAIALLSRLLLMRAVRVLVHLLVWWSLSLLRVGFVEVGGRELLVLRKKRRTESCHWGATNSSE
jgi:hypothetical protein